MAIEKNNEILYPPISFVETFHEILVRQSGEPGYLRRDMVTACIDWSKTEIYDYVPFPGLLKRGAAILYAYIIFHLFVDGNKRTALMTSSFFFFINGYSLGIPDDSPRVYERCC